METLLDLVVAAFCSSCLCWSKDLKSEATITAGYITNNVMNNEGVTNSAFGGGGIYVNGYDFNGFKNGHLLYD